MTITRHSRHPRARRESLGFSLMEVLVAIGLFAIGFAAVASIFPAGALLQRQSADDVQSRHLARNAEAIITGTPVTASDLDFYYQTDPSYHHVGHDYWRGLTQFPLPALDALWTRENSSYPTTINDYVDDEPENTALERSFYWAPLIRDKSDTAGGPADPDWELIVFVLRRHETREYNIGDSDHQYPEVDTEGLPSLLRLSVTDVDDNEYELNITPLGQNLDNVLRANDWVVDDAGGIYRIQSVGSNTITIRGNIRTSPQYDTNGDEIPNDPFPTTIWFAPAPRPGDRSPAQQVIRIDDLPESWGQ